MSPRLQLTAAGREIAIRVIRAHRLLERYLADELQMPLDTIHLTADRREHGLTPEKTAELEAQLGYPAHDPHGDPIPRRDGWMPMVESVALTEQPPGEPGNVVHIEDEPPEVFRQIIAAGLEPGMRVEVLEVTGQHVVVWDGQREHVLAPIAAGNVFVARLGRPLPTPARLSLLTPGQAGRVVALRCEGLTRRRLLDLGLTPGTVVECAFPALFGEPRAYRVRGALIALRTDQASQIEIEAVNAATTKGEL
jgi:DtxR family Mn-dependent transcriptional regulator